jgi:hypothetical protein
VRTWAPRGQTPVLQYHFNWKVLSAIAGITWWNFYFQLYQRTIRAPQMVDFLAHLLRHLPGRLLVIWDRSKTHRCHLVGEFVYYPRSMRNLSLEVRLKAIEIANALLDEGYEEGKAIRIAIAKAKECAASRE